MRNIGFASLSDIDAMDDSSAALAIKALKPRVTGVQGVESLTGIWQVKRDDYEYLKPTIDLTAQLRGKPEICDQIVKFSENLLIYGQLAMGCTPQVREAFKSKMRHVKEQSK